MICVLLSILGQAYGIPYRCIVPQRLKISLLQVDAFLADFYAERNSNL